MAASSTFMESLFGPAGRSKLGVAPACILQLRRRVCQKRKQIIDRATLPCIPQEVVLDLPQEVFTVLMWAASIEITKRVEMGKVLGFIAHFLPTGLIECASGPLVNTALDLTTTNTARQNPE